MLKRRSELLVCPECGDRVEIHQFKVAVGQSRSLPALGWCRGCGYKWELTTREFRSEVPVESTRITT